MTQLLKLFKVFICCPFILQVASAGVSQRQARVLGGGPTTIDNASFVVQILSGDYFTCAGTLVSENFVVSAAHCVDSIEASKLYVIGGITKFNDKGVRSRVVNILTPTAYKRKTFNMDVAVLKLASPMVGNSIKPIELCSTGWENDDPVQIYGWGKTAQDNNSLPDELQTVTLNVVEKQRCVDLYRNRMTLTDSMFCAAAPGKDACAGDSGGPALVNGQFCGVISWGVGCGNSDSPGVYTNLMEAKHFITKAMKY